MNNWQYLTYKELEQIKDPKIKNEYHRKIRQTIEWLNPLYMYALKHGFQDTEFQKQETIHGAITILKEFYDKKNISSEDRLDIVLHRKK